MSILERSAQVRRARSPPGSAGPPALLGDYDQSATSRLGKSVDAFESES